MLASSAAAAGASGSTSRAASCADDAMTTASEASELVQFGQRARDGVGPQPGPEPFGERVGEPVDAASRPGEHRARVAPLGLTGRRLRTADQASLPGLPRLQVGEGRSAPTAGPRRRRRAPPAGVPPLGRSPRRPAAGAAAPPGFPPRRPCASCAADPGRRGGVPPASAPATAAPRRSHPGCRTVPPWATEPIPPPSRGGHPRRRVLRARRPAPGTAPPPTACAPGTNPHPPAAPGRPPAPSGACRRDDRRPRTPRRRRRIELQQPVGDGEAGDAAADHGNPTTSAQRLGQRLGRIHPVGHLRREVVAHHLCSARPGTRGRRSACGCVRRRCRHRGRSARLRCPDRTAPRGGRPRIPRCTRAPRGTPWPPDRGSRPPRADPTTGRRYGRRSARRSWSGPGPTGRAPGRPFPAGRRGTGSCRHSRSACSAGRRLRACAPAVSAR